MVKKFLSKLNQWFNACLIEKNPVIVEEMARYNQICGRIEDHRIISAVWDFAQIVLAGI